MSEGQPSVINTLYLDAEHFILTTESQPPLEPKASVVPAGLPFVGLVPRADGAGPACLDEERTA